MAPCAMVFSFLAVLPLSYVLLGISFRRTSHPLVFWVQSTKRVAEVAKQHFDKFMHETELHCHVELL